MGDEFLDGKNPLRMARQSIDCFATFQLVKS